MDYWVEVARADAVDERGDIMMMYVLTPIRKPVGFDDAEMRSSLTVGFFLVVRFPPVVDIDFVGKDVGFSVARDGTVAQTGCP